MSQRRGLKLGATAGRRPLSRSRSGDKRTPSFGAKGGSFGNGTLRSLASSASSGKTVTVSRSPAERKASRSPARSTMGRTGSGSDALPKKHLRRPPVDRQQRYRTHTGGTFTKDTISTHYEETLAKESTRAVQGLKQRRLMAQNKGPCACFKKLFACCSKFTTVHALNDVSRVVFDALLMEEKDFRSFAVAFDRIDINASGSIDFDEYFEEIEEHRSPFSDYLFTLIDDPTSDIIKIPPDEVEARVLEAGGDFMMAERVRGVLNFNDFVQTAVIYCMYTREDILQFAFRAFDTDGSGFIDDDEFRALASAVNNLNPTYPGNFATAMEDVDSNGDGVIDFDEFKALNERFPLVLFPAFRLQDRLQASTLGRARWIKVNENVLEHSRLERYRTMHAGMLPPRSFCEKLKTCFHDPRWATHKFLKPEPHPKRLVKSSSSGKSPKFANARRITPK